MKFLDEAKVYISSGAGGPGAVSFRREKYVEYGGPDGGKGGRGGDVFAYTDNGLNTLIDYRYKQHFKARPGENGKGANRSGKDGESVTLTLPIGTQIFDEDKETLLFDLTQAGQKIILAKGGDGGRGNASFKSSVNQSPRRNEPGWPGEERWVWLRLKLMADLGLVGKPNAGKSTLLATLTRARPKIGNYPFTTLYPQLGVIWLEDKEMVIADIPGLIEGAHEGKGLGTRFLGHVERTRTLLHLISAEEDDWVATYKEVRHELAAYGNGLSNRQELVAISKCELLDPKDIAKREKQFHKKTGLKPLTFSALAHQNLDKLTKQAFLLHDQAVAIEVEAQAEQDAKQAAIEAAQKGA